MRTMHKLFSEHSEFANRVELWLYERAVEGDATALADAAEFFSLNMAEAIKVLTGRGVKTC